MTSLFAILSLGFILGMRHATDADHVVAVTTIVSQQRSMRFAGVVGAAWGVGHTLTIVIVGGAIILFNVVVPPRVGLLMELSVAIMLVVLGAMTLVRTQRSISAHPHPHPHADSRRPLARSIVIGIVHGLAGSAAIALLILTTIHDPRVSLLYLLLFGIGTVAGMMILTSLIALPFVVAADRFAGLNKRMIQLTSIVSIGLGLCLAYKFGFTGGLFTASPQWTPQ